MQKIVPQVGGLYRFSSGIRVVLSEPQNGCVKVAMPNIRFTEHGDQVQMNEGKVFAYPGIAYLETSSINREYKLGEVMNCALGREWKYVSVLNQKPRVPKKRKRK